MCTHVARFGRPALAALPSAPARCQLAGHAYGCDGPKGSRAPAPECLAGNHGLDLSTDPTFPAAYGSTYDNVLTVGSSDVTGAWVNSSGYDKQVGGSIHAGG